jgi:hypothetical protein
MTIFIATNPPWSSPNFSSATITAAVRVWTPSFLPPAKNPVIATAQTYKLFTFMSFSPASSALVYSSPDYLQLQFMG